VFLIKKEKPLITDDEKNWVISTLKKNKNVEYQIVDIKRKYITIYIA